MSDVTHWAWNGLQYYPSNVPKVQRKLGNIIFPADKEQPIKMQLLPDVDYQIRNIQVNPDSDPPRKDGEWTITYLNSKPIPYPELQFINPGSGMLKNFNPGNTYLIGDKIQYQGKIYICIKPNFDLIFDSTKWKEDTSSPPLSSNAWDKELVTKLFYLPSKIEAISTKDKTKYYFYTFNNGLGGYGQTDKHWLIWWDISLTLTFKDPNDEPFIKTPSGDPDIDNYLPLHKFVVNKIPLPPNLDQ